MLKCIVFMKAPEGNIFDRLEPQIHTDGFHLLKFLQAETVNWHNGWKNNIMLGKKLVSPKLSNNQLLLY